MKKLLVLVFFFFSFFVSGQKDSVYHLSADIPEFINQVKPIYGWKYHKGDDPKWANPSLDDSKWQYLATNFNLSEIPQHTFENIGWFRLHIEADTSLVDKTLALMLTQSGASEVYVDGKLLYSFGTIDTKNSANERHYSPHTMPFDIRFEKARKHVIAVRYANSDALRNFEEDAGDNSPGFLIRIARMRDAIEFNYANSNSVTGIFIFYFAFFFAISFLHLMLFLHYKSNKSNLYYSIFALAFGFTFVFLTVQQNFLYPDTIHAFQTIQSYLHDIYAPALLAMLYTIFYKKIVKIFWLWMAIYVTDIITSLFNAGNQVIGYSGLIILVVESLRIIIVSIYKRREGAWIIGAGVITTILFFTTYTIILSLNGDINFNQTGWIGLFIGVLVILATLSIPLSMTIYLARDFARTSKNLEKKLVEVEELSEKTIEQEKEKQQLLADQNNMLERQVKERTHEITEQKKIIEEKNKDITDSINYAKRIQNAMLPAKELKYKLFPEAFVLFLPKDIVSGDFYWFAEKNGKRLIAAADCTGHGVPGALMSMVGNNILHQLVNEKGLTAPDEILNQLHKEVRTALKQHEQTETRDGMDIALCSITSLENGIERVEYAGAQRPLWIANNEGLSEVKADKYPVGGAQQEVERKFTGHNIELKKGDSFYIFSDGFADQFSVSDKKVMTRKFKEILLSIRHLPMAEQEKHLEEFHVNWKGSMEQTDDVLVIGVKL